MSTLSEFTIFNNLPSEIRFLIWERVEQPVRLIGQVPCSECWDSLSHLRQEDEKRSMRRKCHDSQHPDWNIRYIVHPRTQVIFPPLHACRESRKIWLRRYVQPPRYWKSPITGSDMIVRFDLPFISYEKDIFTMFDAWGASGALDMNQYEPDFDPFGGLDRSRIQNVGCCDMRERFWHASLVIDLDCLPAMETLSIITMGPAPKSEEPMNPPRLFQMTAAQAQDHNCHIRDLVHPDDGRNFSLFNARRPRDPFFTPHPKLEAFDNFFYLWKAWVWHMMERDAPRRYMISEFPWWDFLTYVLGPLGDEEERDVCPLSSVEGCGIGGHSREEVLNWDPPFKFLCKCLCEDSWNAILDDFGAFETTRSHLPLAAAEVRQEERFDEFLADNYGKFWEE